MKAILFILAAATMANADTLYKCTFLSDKGGQKPFKMVGHIISSAAERVTYLTLQPPVVSDLDFDARILITNTGYNPLTIHPRGNTVKAVAHTTLNEEGTTTLEHVDESGLKYELTCTQQN